MSTFKKINSVFCGDLYHDGATPMNSLANFGWVQLVVVLMVTLGHLSTLPLGPSYPEIFHLFGYDPSWIGINVLFIMSGYMTLRSLRRSKSSIEVLKSRGLRIFPYLAVYTLLVIFLVYPLVGKPMDSLSETVRVLSLYALGIISCLNSGEPLPGLLDDAIYDCIIQGTIWTFRWGLLAYICSAILYPTRALNGRAKPLALSLAAIISYAVLHSAVVYNLGSIPDKILPPARLVSMFFVGMGFYAYRKSLITYRNAAVIFVTLLIQFYRLPWSPFIEICISAFWAILAFRLMRGIKTVWPQNLNGLPIAVFIFHWPIGQLLLLQLPNISSLHLMGLGLTVTLVFCCALSLAVNNLTGKIQTKAMTKIQA